MTGKITIPKINEILLEEFMAPMHLSADCLAQEIHVPVSHIQEILNSERRNDAETSLRLARYFKKSDSFFLDMQTDIELRELKENL